MFESNQEGTDWNESSPLLFDSFSAWYLTFLPSFDNYVSMQCNDERVSLLLWNRWLVGGGWSMTARGESEKMMANARSLFLLVCASGSEPIDRHTSYSTVRTVP